mmetsp:Transcript_2370/g.7322  ORF Transcript_2370/g.7322 Transcript_2370/m.7322 type:complete len:352 (+) Transcript_2370:95-1150(+)
MIARSGSGEQDDQDENQDHQEHGAATRDPTVPRGAEHLREEALPRRFRQERVLVRGVARIANRVRFCVLLGHHGHLHVDLAPPLAGPVRMRQFDPTPLSLDSRLTGEAGLANQRGQVQGRLPQSGVAQQPPLPYLELEPRKLAGRLKAELHAKVEDAASVLEPGVRVRLMVLDRVEAALDRFKVELACHVQVGIVVPVDQRHLPCFPHHDAELPLRCGRRSDVHHWRVHSLLWAVDLDPHLHEALRELRARVAQRPELLDLLALVLELVPLRVEPAILEVDHSRSDQVVGHVVGIPHLHLELRDVREHGVQLEPRAKIRVQSVRLVLCTVVVLGDPAIHALQISRRVELHD